MGRRAAHGNGTIHEIDVDSKHHGHESENRGDGGEQYRAQALRAGAHHRLDGVHAAVAQDIVSIDEHDIVVDHDSGQRYHTHTTHDDAKGLPGDEKPEQNTHRGQHDRAENQQRLIKAVELSDENNGHDEKRDAKCFYQKCFRLTLLFVFTFELDADARIDLRGLQPVFDLRDLVVGENAFRYVGLHREHTAAVGAIDGSDAWYGGPLDEITDGHGAAFRGYA